VVWLRRVGKHRPVARFGYPDPYLAVNIADRIAQDPDPADIHFLAFDQARYRLTRAVWPEPPAMGVGLLAGLDPGSLGLLMTLAASASYIAVPAALRLAMPEARPAISLTLSLGITFPFNLVAGIPLYFWLARLVTGSGG